MSDPLIPMTFEAIALVVFFSVMAWTAASLVFGHRAMRVNRDKKPWDWTNGGWWR